MVFKKPSKGSASKGSDGDEFAKEIDQIVNWLGENPASSTAIGVIMGIDISSTLTKFSKNDIMKLGDSMLAMENNKKVLKSWVSQDTNTHTKPQRLSDYLKEISKLQEFLNFSEIEIVAITFMCDCYIEYREKWNDPDKDLTAEELLTRLIQKSVELDEFPPDLFQWGFDLIKRYETIFPTGYKNQSERMGSSWWSHYSYLNESKSATLDRLKAEDELSRDLRSRYTDNS